MEIRLPSSLSLSGNVYENFKRFKQQFELYWEATSNVERSDKQKVSMFLHIAGPEAIEVYNSFSFEENEVRSFANVIKKFEEYATPKLNETYERYIFRSRLQKEGESIDQYAVDLKLKAQSCNFGIILDSMIRDQIVIGVVDKKMRERMLREENLTLDRAIKICQVMEQTNIRLTSLENEFKGSIV